MRCFADTSRRSPRAAALRRSRGFAVLAALTCLLIVVGIVGSMLRSAIRERRQLHVERDRRQCELLLAAGIDRAVARLATDPKYSGDVWELPADAIVDQGAARVTTEISTQATDGTRQARFVAEYPLGRDITIRRSQTFSIDSNTIR
jgi:type II secretory pathway component PulK